MSQSSITSQVGHTGAIVRLARFVLAHRRLVVLLWVLLLPAGIYGAAHVSKRLSSSFSLPGQPGYETAQKITHLYGNGGDTSPPVVLVTLPPGQIVERDGQQLARAFDQARAAVPRDRVVDYSATGDARFITGGGRSTFALLFSPAGKGSPVQRSRRRSTMRSRARCRPERRLASPALTSSQAVAARAGRACSWRR